MPVDSEDIRVFWFKGHASIPDQWSEDTDGSERYFQGEDSSWNPATDPLTGGGAHNHTEAANHTHQGIEHTHAFSAGPASNTTDVGVCADTPPYGMGQWCDSNHTHPAKASGGATLSYTSKSITIANATHNYPHLDVILLKPTSAGADIPPEALVFSESGTPPEGYANISGHGDYQSAWNNKFLRGTTSSGDGGGTGGSTTHKHSFTHTGGSHAATPSTHTHPSVGASGGAEANTQPPWPYRQRIVRIVFHCNVSLAAGSAGSLSDDTEYSDDAGFEPAWIKLLGIYNSSGMAATPVGVIVAFVGASGDIPDDWQLCDGVGADSDYNCTDKHVKMTVDVGSIGDTGGDNNHTHTSTHGHNHDAAGHGHTAVVTLNSTSAVAGAGSAHNCMNIAFFPGDQHDHVWTVDVAVPTVQDANVNFNSADGRAAYKNVLWIKRTAMTPKRPTCGAIHKTDDVALAA